MSGILTGPLCEPTFRCLYGVTQWDMPLSTAVSHLEALSGCATLKMDAMMGKEAGEHLRRLFQAGTDMATPSDSNKASRMMRRAIDALKRENPGKVAFPIDQVNQRITQGGI